MKASDWDRYLEWLAKEYPEVSEKYAEVLPIRLSEIEEKWLRLRKEEV